MDIENSMVVGAQDVYDGCGRFVDVLPKVRDALEYFTNTDDGIAELHEHLLDDGYYEILRMLVISVKTGQKNGVSVDRAIHKVESAVEYLANKKVNGVHQ